MIAEFSFLNFIDPFWQIIKSFWYFWLMIAGFIGIQMFFSWFEKWLGKRRIKKWLEEHKTLEEWKKADPIKFEKITATIFENLGYKVKIIGGAGDRGIDVIAVKNTKRVFIQCKRKDKVPPSDIREFYGSIVNRLKEGEKGSFVTTGQFTEEGEGFVKDKPIELIDGIKLEKLANKVSKIN